MNFNLLNNKSFAVALIAIIAALIFIPFIGNCPLFDWDEVNFAECAREMVVSGNYSQVQLNFRPFWEKPPFFIWLQAVSMNVFGINEFAARFPNALCGIITLIALFVIGRKFHSVKFGFTWCILYTTSLLPHFYFKTGIIDPWFNLFIFLAVYNSYRFINNPFGKKEILNALAGGFFLGMAVLTKGPAALVIAALTIISYFVWTRQINIVKTRSFVLFTLTTLFVSASWFLIEWMKGNGVIIQEFIRYQFRLFETEDAGHGGPFYYHFLVLLFGCFPASLIFLLSYFKYKLLTPFQKEFRKIMVCLFWVVLILFSINETKIIHYSSICYFPLTFVAAIGLVNTFEDLRFVRITKFLYILVAAVITLASLAVGLFRYLKEPLIKSGLIKDEFAIQNLNAEVQWSGFEFVIALIFFFASVCIYRGLEYSKKRLLYTGLIANLIYILLTINVLVPKVEQYTQRAAIEFYKGCAKQNCYVETHGFKSYAYLFYSSRKPSDYANPDQIAYIENQLNEMEKNGYSRLIGFSLSNMLWMEYGKIDRPAYIVVKTIAEKDVLALKGLKKLYQQNGFSFFVRMPSDTAK